MEPVTTNLHGKVSVQSLAQEMANLYHTCNAVTSLVDFYGFRGKGDLTINALEKRIEEQVRSRIHRAWDGRKVIPYVQKHEFEALLFADTQAFVEIGVPPEGVKQLAAIRSSFAPEDIDDKPETAPSKRIAAIVPGYDKVVDGTVVALALDCRPCVQRAQDSARG